MNSATNTIYVLDSANNAVTVINGATNATASVPAGNNPVGIALNAATNKIYVSNANGSPGTVTVIDGATHATTTVNVGSAPRGIDVNSATNKIYVANELDNNVTVIDGATNATTPVSVGVNPMYVAVNSVTNKIYVGNFQDSSVTVINGATNATATVPVTTFSQAIQAIAVNPVTNKIYVANSNNNTVTVIDGASNTTATVHVGIFPDRIAVNSATNTIYVVDYGDNTVTVINGSTNATATVQVGDQPNDIAVNSVTNTTYVANFQGGTISVIDGATNTTTTVPDPALPFAIALNASTNTIYVLNASGSLTTIQGTGGTGPTPTPTPTPTPSGGLTGSARLINISTRAGVGTGANLLIPGFVVSGPGTETLLIRADGPALTQFGVGGVLAQPALSVYSGANVIASNTGWGTNANPSLVASTAAQVGAFAFTAGSADCAVIVNLSAGNYTVQVSGVNGTTGVALAEVYEVSTTGTRLANISTRALVGTGGNILIPGFVISGTGTEELLVRGDGPSLTQFSVSGVLAQVTLGVFNGSAMIASNTGWGTSADPSEIASVAAQVGAFAFAANSADSAQIVNLAAGPYTIQISGVNNTTGVALAEIYEVR